jgi:hypothetical protein
MISRYVTKIFISIETDDIKKKHKKKQKKQEMLCTVVYITKNDNRNEATISS